MLEEKYNSLLANYKIQEKECVDLKAKITKIQLNFSSERHKLEEELHQLNKAKGKIILDFSLTIKKLEEENNSLHSAITKIKSGFSTFQEKEKSKFSLTKKPEQEKMLLELRNILDFKCAHYINNDSPIDINEFEICYDLIQNNSEDFKINFICVICLGVVRKPLTCIECECVFCTKCIDSHLTYSNECPNCKQEMKKKNSKLLNGILETLLLACPLKCEETFIYRDIEKHLAICEKRIKSFKCGLCQDTIKAYRVNDAKLKEHEEMCLNTNRDCIFCAIPVKRISLADHLDTCEKRSIKCNLCNKTYPAETQNAHNSYYCEIARFYNTIDDIIGKL